ncbi:HD domain-containing protein [Candidatus Woesearchaeota archaeon]|nr:HD domain-containing protein [Candidatus Woesearchaeota archaeon]
MKVLTREQKEQDEVRRKEYGFLSDRYTLSSESLGRLNPEEHEEQWRTCFERDLDRIIYSHAYVRLRNKTQVVMIPLEQLLTTRMIHSQEVYQVAIRICSHLGLNQVLAAAIALGHDVGHTPFGHAGEDALTKKIQSILGDDSYVFHHARYGLEVVDRVEKNGKGLNLTQEVRDGILKHSVGASGLEDSMDLPMTAEGRVVRIADKIAYVCSDLDDALRVGMICESDIPQAELKLLGQRKSKWLGALNKAVVESSVKTGDISFDGPYLEALENIRSFMYCNVYGGGRLKDEFNKAKRMISLVFDHVMDGMPGNLSQKDAAFKTLDAVACMTDQSIIQYFNQNFLPQKVY